jgi:CHRD domain
MRGRQLLVIAVAAAAVAACEAREEPETQEMTTPPATETQPMQPEAVTSDVIARADFQPTSAAAGREIRGTAEVRRATGTTGTGTTGTGTTGTGTTGTGTTGTPGSAGEPLELHVRVEGLTAEHSWHVHTGACSQAQAPVAVPFTQPLRATGGTAEQTAPLTQLTQQQLDSGQYSVRVHESTARGAATIACADIQRR